MASRLRHLLAGSSVSASNSFLAAEEALTICAYPMVAPPACNQTYSELVSGRYIGWQVIYGTFGVFATTASVYQLARVYRGGSSLQRGVFPFLLIAALTFCVRAIDPNGYANKLPLLLVYLAGSCCSAAIFSITFAINIIWARLLHGYGDKVPFTSLPYQLGNVFFMLVAWTFVTLNSFLAAKPEQKPASKEMSIIIYTTLMVTGILSAIYIIHAGRNLDARVKETMTLTLDEIARKKGMAKFCCPQLSKRTRVMKIVIMFTVISTIIALAQIFMIFVIVHRKDGAPDNQWRILNDCVATNNLASSKSVPSSVPLKDCQPGFEDEIFPLIQALCMSTLFWVFWKIRISDDNDGDSIKSQGDGASLRMHSSLTHSVSLSLRSASSATSEPSSRRQSLSPPESRNDTPLSTSSYNSSRANQNWDEYMTVEDDSQASISQMEEPHDGIKKQGGNNKGAFRKIKVLP